jgi:PHP family Zn ribbon phosphoesterase
MTFREIERVALQKGVDVMGTGDCFHPTWIGRISDMEEDLDTGLMVYKDSKVQFLPTVEVSCELGRKKIHMLLFFKDMGVAGKIRHSLKKYGNMDKEGRPVLKLSVDDLIDVVKGDFEEVIVISAHTLDPWYGALGDRNRYETAQDAFDILPDALETGLSADKKMVMSIGDLGKSDVVSFSDAHSPANIGREVTVFRGSPSWKAVRDGIITRKTETIEYPPPLGKYHFSGHRKCNYSVDVDGAPLCPKCKKRITMGVEQRLEDLVCAQTHINERYMVPLKQLIALRGEGQYSEEDIEKLYTGLLTQATEIKLLTTRDISRIKGDPQLIDLIQLVRDRQICIIPGYDGRAGKLVNTKKLLWSKMEYADILFQDKKDHEETWKQAERVQELMKSGAMTVTQAEHDRLLQRTVQEPV